MGRRGHICPRLISVHSELGVGSQFDIDFPLIKGGGQLKSDRVIVDKISRGQVRILVIDDEEAIASMVKAQLQRYGYDLVSMTDSGSALSLFQTDPTCFDLIVTDQTMPNFSGLEMAQGMLSLRSDLPIILISGFSSKATESELQRIGIKATLSKPVPIVKLANTVRSLLDSV